MNHEERLGDLERRMSASERERVSILELLNRNQETTEKIANDTQELRELWSEARSAFRFFTRLVSIGRAFIKFVVLPLAILLGAVYAWVHEGKAPTWLHAIADMVE